MSGRTAKDYAEDYTEPELRERLKEELKAGDRGGRPGQWSARKSQLLTTEYEKQGGGYTHAGERSGAQRHLEQWTGQDWRTADGSTGARDGDQTHRYLPDAAWQLLSRSEREATDRRKTDAHDEQHVANTDAAKEARAVAELLDLPAREAARAVRRMTTRTALDRAEKAERQLGRARRTVLDAIEHHRGRL